MCVLVPSNQKERGLVQKEMHDKVGAMLVLVADSANSRGVETVGKKNFAKR